MCSVQHQRIPHLGPTRHGECEGDADGEGWHGECEGDDGAKGWHGECKGEDNAEGEGIIQGNGNSLPVGLVLVGKMAVHSLGQVQRS